VCHEPIVDVKRLPKEIQGKVYVPSRDGEIEDVEIVMEKAPPSLGEINMGAGDDEQ
jgi:hypothetical protein